MDCVDLAELSNADYLNRLSRQAASAGIPLSASIELTERCNLHCVHCYLGDQDALRHHRARELNTAQWLNVIDQIADLGCLYLLITGGDPLLRKDFAEIYTHARRRGLLVTVFTNGTLITDEIVALFRELPPFVVEITLYGATPGTYEAITGVPGSYSRCLAGFEKLRALGLDARLKTILMKPNQQEFAQIADFCRARSHRGKFRFDFEIQGCLNGDKGPIALRLDPEEAVRMEFTQLDRAATWRDYYQKRLPLKLANPDRLYQCGAGTGMFHVDPYGQLQPCLTVHHIAFDLAEGTVAEGLAILQQRLAALKAPEGSACGQCSQRMVCSSCPAFSYLESGIEQKPSNFQCQVTWARSRVLKQQEVLPA